jgi:N-acetylglutamate synthase-like GNAT family acetyltransferase
MNTEIKACNNKDFELVKKLIQEFELDDRQLRQDEFLVMTKNNELIGFGRVREHEGLSEMCSTGITPPFRNKGYGVRLLKALEQKAKQPVYLVCVIPLYFEKLGFEICHHYPAQMEDKLNYCINGLPVNETYVVMKKRH